MFQLLDMRPRVAIWFLWAVAIPAALGQVSVQYSGGTSPQVAAGVQGRIELTDDQYFAFYSKKAQLRVPYDHINLIEYGQQVSARIVQAIALRPLVSGAELLALTKSRKHFLTIGYTGENGKQQALVFRVDKSGIRAALVSIEARTGLKVAYQDEEARKANE